MAECFKFQKILEKPSKKQIVTGKRGSGKTSFVNTLKRKMNQVESVNVECGIEYDVKAMLLDPEKIADGCGWLQNQYK